MSMNIVVEGLDELRKSFKKAPEKVTPILIDAVKKAGALVARVEKEETPVKSATLRRSIELEYAPISIKITPTANYAEYVHNGTGLFGKNKTMITPKKAKAMAFTGKNGLVFLRKSKGQPPNPFVERTIERTTDEVNRIFNEAQEEIIKKL